MTDTDYRLPTVIYVDDVLGPRDSRIPIYPPEGLFEVTRQSTGLLDIEHVMARKPWSFEEAMARFDRERWLKQVDAQTAADEQRRAADRTKTGPTPSRKQARKAGKTAAGQAAKEQHGRKGR